MLIKPVRTEYEDVYFVSSSDQASFYGVYSSDDDFAWQWDAAFIDLADAEEYVKRKTHV